MKVKILHRDGSTYPIAFCELCDKPIDGTEPAEYLIPDIAEGEYREPVVGHYRCTSKVEKSAPSGVIYGNQSVGHLLMCPTVEPKELRAMSSQPELRRHRLNTIDIADEGKPHRSSSRQVAAFLMERNCK